jgi:hypothetical protein
MAKSWNEVVALPAYQALTPEKQERLRNAYFEEVLAPALDYTELATAREVFDAETAPPAPPQPNSSWVGDVVDLAQKGAYDAAGGVLDLAGLDSGAEWLYDQGQAQEATLTPETQAARAQPLFDDQGDYYLGAGFTNPRAWLAAGAETLGGMALPIPGGALAKAAIRPLLGLGRAATVAKEALVAGGLTERAATAAARQAAPDWRDTAAMVAGYGGMEGAVSGGLTEREVRERALAMPWEQVQQDPAYWQAVQAENGDLEAAKVRWAEDLGKSAGLKVAAGTAVLGAGAGRFYDKLIGGGGTGSRLRNIGQGGATETLEEIPQAGFETLMQNQTLQQVDPNIGLTDGLVANMLTGGALGGLAGGTIAGVMPKGRRPEGETDPGQVPPGTDPTTGGTLPPVAPGTGPGMVPPGGPGAGLPGGVPPVTGTGTGPGAGMPGVPGSPLGGMPPPGQGGMPPAPRVEAVGPLSRAVNRGADAQELGLGSVVPAPTVDPADQARADQMTVQEQQRQEEEQLLAQHRAEQAALKTQREAIKTAQVARQAGLGGSPKQGATVPAVEPVRGDPTGPRPQEDVWSDTPDLTEPVEKEDGTWITTRRPSKDGRWDLYEDISPDGESVNQEVWPRQQPAPAPTGAAETPRSITATQEQPDADSLQGQGRQAPDAKTPPAEVGAAVSQGRPMDLAAAGLPSPEAGLETTAPGQGSPGLRRKMGGLAALGLPGADAGLGTVVAGEGAPELKGEKRVVAETPTPPATVTPAEPTGAPDAAAPAQMETPTTAALARLQAHYAAMSGLGTRAKRIAARAKQGRELRDELAGRGYAVNERDNDEGKVFAVTVGPYQVVARQYTDLGRRTAVAINDTRTGTGEWVEEPLLEGAHGLAALDLGIERAEAMAKAANPPAAVVSSEAPTEGVNPSEMPTSSAKDQAAGAAASEKPAEYRYALVNRPAMVGGVPKGMTRVDPRPEPGQDHHALARHGVVVYDRPLSVKEQEDFELAPVLDSAEQEALAAELANDMEDEYVAGALEMAAKDPGFWDQAVAGDLERKFGRRGVSVGQDFNARVLEKLKARQTQAVKQKTKAAPAKADPAEAVDETAVAAEPTPTVDDTVTREAERVRRLQAAEVTVRRAALGSPEVQLAALSVARGDEGMQDTLRLVLRQAIGKAIGAELNRVVKEEGDAEAMSAVIQSLGALTSDAKGADGLNPEVFTDEALAAWGAEAVRAARRVVREERKAEHEQVILAAATGAWKASGFWQPDPDEMVQGLERQFLTGWNHALEGGTGSNLETVWPPTDFKLRRMGYDAAVTWLGTEDGKAFVTGAKPRKMQGVGEQFRRRQDERKVRLAALDVSQDDQTAALVEALLTETERAGLFPLPEVGEGQATPGLWRYLQELRGKILPFKEWMSHHGYGGSRQYMATPGEALAREAKRGQEQREGLRAMAEYYIDQVAGLAQVFGAAKTVDEAATALLRWARRDGEATLPKEYGTLASEELSEGMKSLLGYVPDKVPGTSLLRRSVLRGHGGMTKYVLSYFFPQGLSAQGHANNEAKANDTTRNQPLKRPRFDRVERIGEDYRGGRQIAAEELTTTFGLKGVTYGQGVTAKQRQDHTNYAFDAFMDLAKTLGIEPRHIGMGGKLTFAFGALGHGRHAAHYTPDNNGQGQAINLTNTRGDGAVAHEWFHALDWNLRPTVGGGADEQVAALKDLVAVLSYSIPSLEAIEQELDRFLSGKLSWQRLRGGATDHAAKFLERTITDLSNIIWSGSSRDRWTGARATQFKTQADALGKDYWGNPAELLARAGEAWIYDRLGGSNNYLVSDWVEALRVTAPQYRGQPYPSGDERAVFNDAFERLMQEVQWTDAGPMLKTGWLGYEIVDADGDRVLLSQDKAKAERFLAARAAKGENDLSLREVKIPSDGWEGSPLKAKARDGIARAEALLEGLTQRSRDLQAEAAATAAAAARASEAGRLAREQAEAERVRAEWAALQAQQAPVPEVTAGGALSLDELSALFDAADAEVEEERQEAARETEPAATAEKTEDAATGPTFVDDPNAAVIALARRLAGRSWREPLTWRELGTLADESFGGTKAEGKYTPKDAYDAVEMALNLVVNQPNETFGHGVTTLAEDAVYRSRRVEQGFAKLLDLDNAMPTQTNRTEEQDEFQQFSTPHTHAALMVRVANIQPDDVVLEPSAGSGNLATMAQAARPLAVVVNELAPRRAAILRALGFPLVYTENAEQLSHILGPKGLKATVVIMNPPFSASAGRVAGQRDNRIGAQHVEAALKLLAPGGRAVILMGKGYTRGHARLRTHWAWLLKNYNVRANIGLDGSQYKKFGTSFDNRLVIIDNTGPTPDPAAILGGEGRTVADALKLLEDIRHDRVHVGDGFGPESGGGQVAEAGSLPGGTPDAGAAATGPVGDGQPGDVGTLGAGPGGVGVAVAAAGTASGKRPGGRGRNPGVARRPRPGATAEPTGADAGGRGGAGAGTDVRPDGDADGGLGAAPAASLAHAAAEFAKHGVEGIDAALSGLAELFGGANRLRSFPGGIDEETYAKAKPHFERAATAFLAAGNDFKEFFKVLIRAFGSGIKPYAMRFAAEWQARGPAESAPVDATPANEPVLDEAVPAGLPPVLSDSIYEGYSPLPAWAEQWGAKPHPGALVESAAMAAVKLPALTVTLGFPRAVYTEGRLSAAQLDAVAYTEQAHQRILPNGDRQGFFIGDGTGVGKGREVAGIIYQNWLSGRRKAVWLSANNDLLQDSKDYLQAVAGSELGLFNLGKTKADKPVEAAEGVAFVTYPMLRSSGQGVKDATGKKIADGKARIDQLIEWLGADFDGVIAFDEAHNLGNALTQKGTRGNTKPSAQALAGVELQRRLPKARVVYVSATGATEAANLGYLTRLGLWGEGTPFADVKAFVASVASSGLAAMEVVAKDMKALGVYLARSLPFHEVSYAQLEHALTTDQQAMYDTLAHVWQIVLQDIGAALGDTKQGMNGDAKGAALAQFWGAQQRFFNQTLTSLQMPSLIQSIEADLAAGRAPILQFVNTNEASQEREAAKLAAEGRDLEEMDITPRQILLQYLQNSFPVNQFEEYTDDNGDTKTRPVTDSQGNPVENVEAVAARDSLMDQVAQLRFPDNPIDIVVGQFGSAQVAEITGRKRRFVRDPQTGKVTEEKRNDALRAREVDEFQGDQRRILIFSDKGGTGKSYHADLKAKNQRKRVHYVVQAGWRADKAIQGLGRSHRTNQAQAPHVVLVMTDLRGHRRFVASIARRMDQLGALTKGQRKTGGQGLFTEDMNLESELATAALERLIVDVMAGQVAGVDRETLTVAMGLNFEAKGTRQKKQAGMPTIQQFLNRILVLEVERQNGLFDAFSERLARQIEQARENGTLDMGLENIRADKVVQVSEREVYTHPRTGATTRLVELALTNAVQLWAFDALMASMLARGQTPFFARNTRSGQVWAFTPGADVTDRSGMVKQSWRRWGLKAGQSGRVDREEVGDPRREAWQNRDAQTRWEYLDLATASQAWAEQYATAPKEETHSEHLLSGVLLPIWDRLSDMGQVRVMRALTDAGEMVLGRLVNPNKVDQVLLRLTGSSRTAGMTPQAIFDAVLQRRATAVLANNWRLAHRRVANNPRIELTGMIDFSAGQLLKKQGVIFERIGFEGRYFIPTDPETGVAVLTRVLENRPVIELVGEAGPAFSKTVPGGPTLKKGDKIRVADSATAGGGKVAGITGTVLRSWGDQYVVKVDDIGDFILSSEELVLDGKKQRFSRITASENERRVDAYVAANALAMNQFEWRYAEPGETFQRVVWETIGNGTLEPNALDVVGLGHDDQVSALHVTSEPESWATQLQEDYGRGGRYRIITIEAMAGDIVVEDVQQAIQSEIFGRKLDSGILVTGRPLLKRKPDGVYFAKGYAQVAGGSVTAITQAVRRMMRPWANAPRPVVFQGMDDPQVDAEVRKAYAEESARRKAEDPKAKPDLVEGFYFRGQVYINAEAVRNVADLERVLRHETLGHAGLRGLFGGPELDALLDRLARARWVQVASMASSRGLDMTDRTQRRQAAEEVLAELAQWRPEIGWVRQLLAIVKAKLREWGVLDADKLSDAEILREYVIPARNFIERGRAAEGVIRLRPRLAPVFSVRLTDPGGSPLGGGKAFLESVQQWLGDSWQGRVASENYSVLGALTLRQLAEVGAKWLPGIQLYDRLRTTMETRRNVMMEEAGRLGDGVDSWARKHPAEARAVFELENETTLAQVDPSDYQVLMIPLKLGPGPEMLRNWAATEENVKELRKRARAWRRSKQVRERELAAYYSAAADKLNLALRAERRRQAALPELARKWAALSSGPQRLGADGAPFATEQAARAALTAQRWPKGVVTVVEAVPGGWAIQELGGQQVYTRMRDLYKKRSDEMLAALIKRLESLESLDEASKQALAARIRAEFENPMDEKGNPRVGPYFPLQRFGRFYLTAQRLPTGEARTWRRQDGEPFPSEQAARSALGKRADLHGVSAKVVPLEDGTGFVLEEVPEFGFWLAESVGERRKLAAELVVEGWRIQGQGLTAQAHKELQGVSEGFIADAVTQLQEQGAKEEADMLYQMYLQTLTQMSIRKHFIHRKGTTGYTADQLRAYGYNMTRLAHQVSKLELMPDLERVIRDIEAELKEAKRASQGLDTTRQNAMLEELKKRHDWVAAPENAPWTNALSALGFVFYLGVSPAAALVNLSQVPIVGLPVLAARYGSWGAAAKGLTTAFVDVARGFNPAVLKGFITGRPLPSDAANLTEEERRAFAEWDKTGARDRTQAHNLAGIGDADNWLNGPTFNRVMGAVSSLFHAAEVVNRDATLLAAYRLGRAKGLEHETAVLQAEAATWEAHFDYSNANRARMMQGNVAKVLLMFKNYSQHVLYFLGRNLFLSVKGESAEVKREARTKFAGMVGMTALFAGAAGLPVGGLFVMANLLQGMFGDDDEPWDAEIEFRNWLAATFPEGVSDVLDRGAVNTLTGLDFSSRVSIGDLIWRAPDRDLDGAGMFQHITEQMLGPVGGLAARPFTMYDELREGRWVRAAEAASPKFLRDLVQSGRFAEEGVLTRKGAEILAPGELSSFELFAKAMGMNPDDLAVRYQQNSAIKLYEQRITDRRRVLVAAAAMAIMAKDTQGQAAAREKIAAFNKAHPEIKIGIETLKRSVRAREMMRDRAKGGIAINPKLDYLREQAGGFGEQPTEDEEEEG